MPAPSDPSNRTPDRVLDETSPSAERDEDRDEDRDDSRLPAAPDEADVPIEQLTTEPPPVVEEGEVAPPVHSASPPVKHMGRVVDPDVADEQDVSIEQRRRRNSIPDEPSLRPHTFEPMPSSEELLDPGKPPPPMPRHQPRRAAPSVLTPRMTAVFGALFGLAGIVAVFAVLNRVSPQSAEASPAKVTAEPAASAAPAPVATRALAGLGELEEEGPVLPGPWRVSELAEEDGIRMVSGTVGLQPFVTTLQSKGVSKKETYRILAAFKKFDRFKRPGRHDEFLVAWNRVKNKVAGFELKVSALEIYQAKENDEGLLVGSKLDMKVETRVRETAVRVTGGDLAEDLKRARLRESVTSVIDAAFDGRASVSSMPKRSSLRVILQEKTALGRFAEYDHVEALEYVSGAADSKTMRLYRFKDGHRYGYFDQNGREPYRGGWRTPCPGAPITSHFNLKRMHPILKRIKPHNGTDYGAPTGTPVHATSYGTISWIGPKGPAGNLVIIDHPGDIQSYYMHLHRFATGLKKGDKVETFQVIGTVGNTGRSTGAHLHFGMKKKGKYVNPLSFKLDGHRLVTASRRDDFEKAKAAYDEKLDAIELPPAEPDPAQEPAEEPAQEPDTPAAAEPPAKEPEVDPTTPRENFDDDEELEPLGSVADEPVDEVY